jgi:hypothetical protein
MIMGNGVFIPPRDFKQPSRSYYRVKEGTKYEIEVVTYSITYVPVFVNFRAVILWLLNSSNGGISSEYAGLD